MPLPLPRKTSATTGKTDENVRGGIGLRLHSFTVAELATPDFLPAKHPGAIVACSNGNAGNPCLVFSNGTAWKVIALGATAAAS
jgi:hypothetical protein